MTKAPTLSHCVGAGLGGHGGNALHMELAGCDVEVAVAAGVRMEKDGFTSLTSLAQSWVGRIVGLSCTLAVLLLPVLREEDREGRW